MRTIDATLLTAQKTLSGKPAHSLIVGGALDLSTYLLAYEYREAPDRSAVITLTLDNRSGYFNSLPAALVEGAYVTLQRGLKIGASTYLPQLPRFWIEKWFYTWEDSQALFTIHCNDWWEKLETWSPATDQIWTATEVQTIASWILSQVGLTLAAGTWTSTLIDFT